MFLRKKQCSSRTVIHIWWECLVGQFDLRFTVQDGLISIKLKSSHVYANKDTENGPSAHHTVSIMHRAALSPALHRKWIQSNNLTYVITSSLCALLVESQVLLIHTLNCTMCISIRYRGVWQRPENENGLFFKLNANINSDISCWC